MATSTSPHCLESIVVRYCYLLLVVVVLSEISCIGGAEIGGVYVFGDSLADVGNNNHLPFSLLKANFPHNGVDFAGRKPTGRFSNGKNTADFLAEMLGLPSSPPYLNVASSSNTTEAFLNGVSFASGGAGILDSTNSGQCLSFNDQIDYYATVYGSLVQQLGSSQAQGHLSKSLFAFIIGSNDMLNINKSNSGKSTSPQQFVGSLIVSLRGQLKRIYNLGARKFVFMGTGPLGCCPSQRSHSSTGDCDVEQNYLSAQYNKAAISLLQEMKSELGDMSYTFFDTYNALLQYIQNPAPYGFVEVKAACCGLGNLKGKVGCLPISTFCPNREDHLFWDFYHPSEKTAGLMTSIIINGSQPYVYPINVKQLISL